MGTPGWYPGVLGDAGLGDPGVAPSALGCCHLRTPVRCDPSSTPRAGRTRRPGARRRGAGGSPGRWAPPGPPRPSPTPQRGCRRAGVPSVASLAGPRPAAGTLGTSRAGRHPGHGTPVGLGAGGVPGMSPTCSLAGVLTAPLGCCVLLPLEGLRVLALTGALRVGALGGTGPPLPPRPPKVPRPWVPSPGPYRLPQVPDMGVASPFSAPSHPVPLSPDPFPLSQ